MRSDCDSHDDIQAAAEKNYQYYSGEIVKINGKGLSIISKQISKMENWKNSEKPSESLQPKKRCFFSTKLYILLLRALRYRNHHYETLFDFTILLSNVDDHII